MTMGQQFVGCRELSEVTGRPHVYCMLHTHGVDCPVASDTMVPRHCHAVSVESCLLRSNTQFYCMPV